MAQTLIPVDRQARIQKLIEEKGIVRVSELSKLFGVTELTIRRDFDVLEKRGVLERTHGGAILRRRLKVEPLYVEKNQKHRTQKEKIGIAVAKIIEPGDTLLINTGSTNTQVLRHLSGKNLRVITSNANALTEIENPEIEVVLTGGLFRRQSNSLIGNFTHTLLKNVCGSKAIIGVDGVSIRFGLTTPIQEEAAVARLMIDQTLGPVIVVADSSKMGVVSNFVTASIDKVNILVTDAGIKTGVKKELEEMGITVIIAK
ncbi:DeoR/GlpR family DNA-binding transcription regulator [Desulfobacula sp.]|uniref:DeoR/GlpR family DNA-binding transcription regulator n=1 Tax=Desulfobacula sp. TaxID=2593537 RepID=UPI0025C41F17|nr:DeoR/GlpR family DNA-binding transcription regulator [Desulfobacula sp.]MBC2703403.1 DeoR/GlpR transcriptional regulator [Desulfobacula sp.]